MHRLMDFIWYHHDDRKMPSCQLAEKITEARRRIAQMLAGPQDRIRDLLFLDIALGDFLRVVAERDLGPDKDPNELVDLAASILENLRLFGRGAELDYVRKDWDRLGKMPRFDREWSLHAKAVSDRMAAVVAEYVYMLNSLLQPKAEFLGKEFHAEKWAAELFSEEVVRGLPVFALSLVLRYLDPLLRKSAHLGNWQVISPGEGTAEIAVAETLMSVQGRSFSQPVLIVTDKVSGDEEIPGGVVAIITSAVVDILAHLAVRARNAGVLFATCYDGGLIDSLKSLRGHTVKIGTRGGDVVFEESSSPAVTVTKRRAAPVRRAVSRPSFTSYALTMEQFNEGNVGGKSNHLKRLRGRLPDWIHLPASAAIPFGVFEKVLTDKVNSEPAKEYSRLLSEVEKGVEDTAKILQALSGNILKLAPPDKFIASLRAAMEKSGLRWPENWEDAWTCIRKVWASKWNERAYLSRKANNISHDDLFMAVLIQSIVSADYSYVIHTVNPSTGAREEIYAEAVKGLGEALVGNYPGKAYSFTCRKGEPQPQLLSFPSKREGLFGAGMIFRSDSNGEDLAGFAGAGLYDSFIFPKPRRITLDYSADPLIWDDSFRKDFSARIAEIGEHVEEALGTPQDIEGAYTEGNYFVVQTRPQVGIKDE
jgi:alpha-glucan,water dikinase